MAKENHTVPRLPQELVDRLWLWQRKMRAVSGLIPSRKLPLLTQAQAYGPDLERFRNANQSLVAWWDKQSQWWVFRGTLKTSRGRLLGFQLGFFDRHTQNDFFGAVPARWITPRAYGAHFALTDPMNGQPDCLFRYWQQGGLFSRTPGFAADDRFHVEVGGWYAFRRENGEIQLFANGAGDSIHLELSETKPMVYHGQSGYAEAEPGASFYCSYSRMATQGRVLLDGRLEEVQGLSWMDHEKLTLKQNLMPAQHELITLHLSDGRDLMVRLAGGAPTGGTWVEVDGAARHLIATDIQLENMEYWISSETHARYPIKRKLRVEALGLELDLKAMPPEQELDTTRTTFASQWAGLVTASGVLRGNNVEAQGFMSLVGFDARPRTRVLEFLTRG